MFGEDAQGSTPQDDSVSTAKPAGAAGMIPVNRRGLTSISQQTRAPRVILPFVANQQTLATVEIQWDSQKMARGRGRTISKLKALSQPLLFVIFSKGGITRSDLSVDQFRPDISAAGYPDPADFEGMFPDIMTWLRDEGIIRIGEVADDGRGGSFFTDCVITGRGMNLLRQKSDVLGGATAADVIMSTKDRDASASQLVKFGGLIGGVIGGFTKSAG